MTKKLFASGVGERSIQTTHAFEREELVNRRDHSITVLEKRKSGPTHEIADKGPKADLRFGKEKNTRDCKLEDGDADVRKAKNTMLLFFEANH